MSPPVLDRWLTAVLATSGLTAITDPALARARLLDDALRAAEIVAANDGAIALNTPANDADATGAA